MIERFHQVSKSKPAMTLSMVSSGQRLVPARLEVFMASGAQFCFRALSEAGPFLKQAFSV